MFIFDAKNYHRLKPFNINQPDNKKKTRKKTNYLKKTKTHIEDMYQNKHQNRIQVLLLLYKPFNLFLDIVMVMCICVIDGCCYPIQWQKKNHFWLDQHQHQKTLSFHQQI